MVPAAQLRRIQSDSDALARAALRDLNAEVPSCPGWDVAELVRHLSSVHRWVTQVVSERARERPSDFGARIHGPTDESALVGWFEQGAADLISALSDAGLDEEMWNWSGSGFVSGFWFRRMANETAVHRWDAQNAVGDPQPIDPQHASDAIDEMLTVVLSLLAARVTDFTLGGTIHIHCTDTPGEWLVSHDCRETRREHAKGDAVLRGPASDLLLVLMNRLPASGVEVMGDRNVIEAWSRNVRW
jgi:uncharacterized protein (TIGR03083 family)